MDKMEELHENVILIYSGCGGEKVRVNKCMGICKDLLLNKDGDINVEAVSELRAKTGLGLTWNVRGDRRVVAISYKDMAIEFASYPLK